MKKALILAFIISPLFCKGQWSQYKRTPKAMDIAYTIDTLRYKGNVVLMQRFQQEELDKVYGKSSSNNNVATSLLKLQEQLQSMNSYYRARRVINFGDVAEKHISDIKKQNTEFDPTLLETELHFYLSFSDMLTDSINAVELAAAKRKMEQKEKFEQERRDREEAARLKYQQDLREAAIRDSLAEIQAKKDHIVFEKECIKKYGKAYGKSIAEGKVMLGMNKEMCELAWGDAHLTNKTITRNVVVETWTYTITHFLIFKNGILSMINE